MAVSCQGGLARFVTPSPLPGSRTLVIVSTLGTTPGPFPIQLSARSVGPAEPRSPVDALPSPLARTVNPRSRPPVALEPVGPEATARPPESQFFHLMTREGDVASASNYEEVAAGLRGIGRRVQVYVDSSEDSAVPNALVEDIVRTFDDRVFPVAAATIGQARDIDGDGRFTVLLSGKLSRLGGGRHAVDGFVRGADLDPAYPSPISNHRDMMYLNTALTPGPHLRTVIAHEYTHAVSFSTRGSKAPGLEEEGWLDEAIAHLVEDLHGFSRSNLDYRVSAFLSQPERYALVVQDYYAADLFRSHGNRGATYLFLRWCVDRFGPGLIPALVRSDRKGVANIEAGTGRPFPELYRDWSLALYLSGLDPDRDDPDGLQSVTTRGAFGRWELAGPRTTEVEPEGPPLSWLSEGTASRFLVIGPSTAGGVEVEILAPDSAGLQVTALPLPDDLPGLELSVRAATLPDGLPALLAELRAVRGSGVRLESLSWEPLVPRPNPRSAHFRRDGLTRDALARAFGRSVLTEGSVLRSHPLQAAEALAEDSPLVVKAVGADAKGRKVTAWAVLPRRPTRSDSN